jgi:transposase-like protein
MHTDFVLDALLAYCMPDSQSKRGPYRRHSQEFKLQLCSDIQHGKLGRREAQKTYRISANLIPLWLNQDDNGELDREEAALDGLSFDGLHVERPEALR